MTRQEANAYLCIMLEVVDESPNGVPSGHMYAAMMAGAGMELGDFQALQQIAKEGGLVNVAPSHLVTITPKGKEMVAKIKAFKAKQA